MKEIKLYLCDKCGAEFRRKRHCEQHEKDCTIKNCYNCKHSYGAYGCEFNCDLQNNGKDCQYEGRE